MLEELAWTTSGLKIGQLERVDAEQVTTQLRRLLKMSRTHTVVAKELRTDIKTSPRRLRVVPVQVYGT